MTNPRNEEDWKKRLDEYLSRKEENERRQKEEQGRREWDEKVKRLSARFRCSICERPSQFPRIHVSYDADGLTEKYTDWDRPGDLWECSRCGQWVCEDHIHRWICKNCALELL